MEPPSVPAAVSRLQVEPRSERTARRGTSLVRARRMLEDAIARERRRLAAGVPIPAGRLAHLRATRAGLEARARGDEEAAIDSFERAIAADGQVGYAYLFLGELYLDAGRTEAARPFLQRAAELLPEDAGLAAEIEILRTRAQAGEERHARRTRRRRS